MRKLLFLVAVLVVAVIPLVIGANYTCNEKIDVAIQSPIESNGAIPVNIQDQHSEIIDLYAHKDVSELTLSSPVSVGSFSIEVGTGHGITLGQLICVKESTRYFQARVLYVASISEEILMDTPADFAFSLSAEVHNAEHELAVNGDVTRQIFDISPPVGVEWDITRILFYIQDQTAMDTAKFGGRAALTKGIFVRVINGHNKVLFNIKTNGEFAQRAYDVSYSDKAPAGFYGFTSRRTFAGQDKNGVTIRLDGDTGDSLQVVVQDDLTALDHFHVVIQGHAVTD